MSQTDLRNEINKPAVGLLLPIEKKLVLVSLITGLLLLAVLAAINSFVGL